MFGKSNLGSICYYVSDIDKTENFYRDVLGLDVQRMGDDGEGNDWLMATTANAIELIFFKQNHVRVIHRLWYSMFPKVA